LLIIFYIDARLRCCRLRERALAFFAILPRHFIIYLREHYAARCRAIRYMPPLSPLLRRRHYDAVMTFTLILRDAASDLLISSRDAMFTRVRDVCVHVDEAVRHVYMRR